MDEDECSPNPLVVKGGPCMLKSTRPANCSSLEVPLMCVCVHPNQKLFNNLRTTDWIKSLGQVKMSLSDIKLLSLWIISFVSNWPILVVPSFSNVSLLISRVVIEVLYAILPVSSSTLSNLLVGSFLLVDSLLILLSLDHGVWKINIGSTTRTSFSSLRVDSW